MFILTLCNNKNALAKQIKGRNNIFIIFDDKIKDIDKKFERKKKRINHCSPPASSSAFVCSSSRSSTTSS